MPDPGRTMGKEGMCCGGGRAGTPCKGKGVEKTSGVRALALVGVDVILREGISHQPAKPAASSLHGESFGLKLLKLFI